MRQPLPGPSELADHVRSGDTMWLARAITLVESRKPAHRGAAAQLLTTLMPDTGGADRVGLTVAVLVAALPWILLAGSVGH